MKPEPTLRRIWNWLPPQTWPEIFGVITLQLLAVIAAAFLLDTLKGLLP